MFYVKRLAATWVNLSEIVRLDDGLAAVPINSSQPCLQVSFHDPKSDTAVFKWLSLTEFLSGLRVSQ